MLHGKIPARGRTLTAFTANVLQANPQNLSSASTYKGEARFNDGFLGGLEGDRPAILAWVVVGGVWKSAWKGC